MVKYSSDPLDGTFAALADPTRRAILARLARGEATVTELAEPFDISLPAISKHLRVLEQAGLVVREKDGRVRRCRLAAGPIQAAAEWIASYRGFWEERFDALGCLPTRIDQGGPGMATQETRTENALTLTRTFAAPRETVFRAWTEPEALKQWFAPTDAYSIPIAEVDVRVGGQYRIGMKPPEGDDRYIVTGTYREVHPPEKLVFTWSWEEGKDIKNIGETLVTVEFRDLGDSTEVVLTHEGFPTEEARNMHTEGWSGCLDRLPRIL